MGSLLSQVSYSLTYPYRSIVLPTDDYIIRCRKTILSCTFLVVPFTTLLCLPFLAKGVSSGFTPAILAGTIASVPCAVVLSVIPWWRMKVTRMWSESAMDWWLFLFNIIIHVFMLCSRNPNFSGVYYIWGIIDVLCQPKHLFWHFLNTFLGFLVFKINVSLYTNQLISFELRFPGAIDVTMYSDVALSIVALIFWSVLMFALSNVLKEYRAELAKARHTADVCHQVSEKMVIYDTKGAHALLEQAVDVDGSLKHALVGMIQNLEMFRPHLPEYVWLVVKKSANLKQVHFKRGESDDTLTGVSDGSASSMSEKMIKTPFTIPQDRSRDGSLVSLFKSDFCEHVYAGMFDFPFMPYVDEVSSSQHDDNGKTTTVRKLVNWAHKNVLKTHGTIHSFVGDTIIATWCFHSPSVKPSIFLSRLYQTFGDSGDGSIKSPLLPSSSSQTHPTSFTSPAWKVGGALCSGSGTSYMAGDRRQGYILHIGWRDVLQKLHCVARENNAVLLDYNTFKSCHRHVVCRWVDVLTLPNIITASNGTYNTKVYEIIREREDHKVLDRMLDDSQSTTDLEGILGNEEDEDTLIPMDAVSVAMEDCVRGRYNDALRILHYDVGVLKAVTRSTMVDRLILKCQENSGAPRLSKEYA